MSSDGAGGVALVALVAFVPLVVLMLTSFVKVSVVLALLRNAIGAPDAPSGLVVMGVSLVLTFFVMAPVAIEMASAAAGDGAAPVPAPVDPYGTRGAAGSGANPAPVDPYASPRGTAPGSASTNVRPAAAGSAAGSAGAAGSANTGAMGSASAGAAGAGAAAGSAGVGGAAAGNANAAGVAAGSASAAGSANTGAMGSASAGTGAAAGSAGAGAAAGGESGVGAERPVGPLVAVDVEAALRRLVPARYRPELDAAARALGPLRGFLAKHAGVRDRATFVDVAKRMGRDVKGDEVWVLAPAFLTTELREAFAIAVLLFIPFLVIDLVVGLGLAALGLQATQPQVVALPLKLLLFVAVDGWRLLIDSLLRGYA